MRTTINLPDGLAEEAKRRAQMTGTTFTSLVVDGLRRVLAEGDSGGETSALPEFGDDGARPLVDIADRDAMARTLDADGLR